METTEKKYRESFTGAELSAYKEKKIAELTSEAIDLLSRAEYLDHARGDMDATLKELGEKAFPLEKELSEINGTKSPNKTQRERRKELERELTPIRRKIGELSDSVAQFQLNALSTREQASERIYRRDYIAESFDKAFDHMRPDPRMKKPEAETKVV